MIYNSLCSVFFSTLGENNILFLINQLINYFRKKAWGRVRSRGGGSERILSRFGTRRARSLTTLSLWTEPKSRAGLFCKLSHPGAPTVLHFREDEADNQRGCSAVYLRADSIMLVALMAEQRGRECWWENLSEPQFLHLQNGLTVHPGQGCSGPPDEMHTDSPGCSAQLISLTIISAYM